MNLFQYHITPRYEFGFGLSYTTFEYSDLVVTTTKPKSPFPSPRPDGIKPPTLDETIPPISDAIFPSGFRKLKKFIYPYIDNPSQIRKGQYPYPKGYDQVQTPSPAGGGEGGNPSLWDIHAQVAVTVTNTGKRTGKEVVQVYVSLPSLQDGSSNTDTSDGCIEGKDFPVRVLRAFEKVELRAGESRVTSLNLTRKDLSYWSVVHQNWVMPTCGSFKINVGRSSRNLLLSTSF